MESRTLAVLGRLATLAGPPGPKRGPALRELGVVEDGAMLVRGGRIEWVGPRQDIPTPLSQVSEVVDASGKVVTPGLIDAHTHPIFGGNRAGEFEMRAEGATYQEIAAAGGGILSTMRATREASEGELVEAGLRHAQWFLANGTTTVEAKSGYGLSLEHELKMLHAIRRLGETTPLTVVPTFLGAHAVPPEFEGRAVDYVETLVEEMLPAVSGEGLARYADAFFEERYFNRAACLRVLGRAKEYGLGVRIHADQLTRSGGAELAAELGAATADHLEQTDLEGIRALREADVHPVLLPGSVYALGLRKFPEARLMIDEGLAPVLATDFNPGSSPVASLPFVMSLACTQMRMTPAEALCACTANGACSLGLGTDRGRLEAGMRADFVVWDCVEPAEIAYWIGAPLVRSVYIEGRLCYPAASG